MAVTGYFTHTGGFFDNDCTGEKCDWERLGGGRWKTQWRNNRGVRIDNTFSFSALDQGGYPYAYAGEDIVRDGKTMNVDVTLDQEDRHPQRPDQL